MTLKVLAAGVKIAITSIDAPVSANAGDWIIVDAHIKNLTADFLYIAPTGSYDSTDLVFQFDYLNVAPGETVVFRAVFSMPDKSVNIAVRSWWWDGSQWVMDDVGSISIALGSWTKLTPAISASISLGIEGGWTKLSNPLTASLSPSVAAGWTKLSNPLTTTLDISAIPAGWTKLSAPITGQINPGFQIPSSYKLVLSKVYPDEKTYSGPAERCYATFSFLPTNWPGTTWFIDHLIVERVADKLSEAGAKPLSLKLYESGFDYIMVIEAAKPAVQSAVAAIQIAWSVVILAALVLAALVVAFFTIKLIVDFIKEAPAAGIGAGLIFLGVAGVAVLGLAIWKGTSIKAAVTGK